MANVTKKDLVDQVSQRTGLNQLDTKLVVETFLDAVGKSLQGGRNIEIRGFGRFKVKQQKAHKARNPRTNESVLVDERYKPTFEASNKLRDRVSDAIMSKKN
jgi:DNA-binding protein HU-beta/integration host factor subunit beta